MSERMSSEPSGRTPKGDPIDVLLSELDILLIGDAERDGVSEDAGEKGAVGEEITLDSPSSRLSDD